MYQKVTRIKISCDTLDFMNGLRYTIHIRIISPHYSILKKISNKYIHFIYTHFSEYMIPR
jgi:hypothetical protein